ncbi:MAG: sporulation protein YqfD, partial [Defluviitaleaceae bacterium]|nr:sporulation protein YqfD [Defluviitaleaceae bacterium]
MGFYNLIKGYVTIEVKGAQLERFLNMAIFHGIPLWDIEREGFLKAKVGVNHFRKLRPIARKTASKIKIIEKSGAPFFIFKHRKRKILLFGTAFFFISLYSLTAFIWDIEINGYENISHDVLMSHLNENGLRLGTLRHSINRFELENSLLENFNISFINLELVGTRAVLIIYEIENTMELEEEIRSEIVAAKAGIIESVTVFSGEAVVVPGQIVK